MFKKFYVMILLAIPLSFLIATNTEAKSLGYFTATAYTDNVRSQGKYVGKTATGMRPRVGVIAVDPSVIPLGTRLYVEGYGYCVAGDTGGAIKGKKIDVFLSSNAQCRKWGKKKVRVFTMD